MTQLLFDDVSGERGVYFPPCVLSLRNVRGKFPRDRFSVHFGAAVPHDVGRWRC